MARCDITFIQFWLTFQCRMIFLNRSMYKVDVLLTEYWALIPDKPTVNAPRSSRLIDAAPGPAYPWWDPPIVASHCATWMPAPEVGSTLHSLRADDLLRGPFASNFHLWLSRATVSFISLIFQTKDEVFRRSFVYLS